MKCHTLNHQKFNIRVDSGRLLMTNILDFLKHDISFYALGEYRYKTAIFQERWTGWMKRWNLMMYFLKPNKLRKWRHHSEFKNMHVFTFNIHAHPRLFSIVFCLTFSFCFLSARDRRWHSTRRNWRQKFYNSQCFFRASIYLTG